MKAEDIIKALNSLEMKSREHVIPEDLRLAIIEALESKPKRGRPKKEDSFGKSPE